MKAQVNLQNGLVAYYPFNGNANDESGNANHGTVNGATLTEDRFGNANSAYSFNGIDNYITISNASSNLQFTGDLSICAWINFSGGVQNPRIVSHDQFNGYEFLTLGTGAIRQLRFHFGNNDITSVIDLNENTLYFVCVSKSGNSITFYANGIVDYQANVINSNASYSIPNPEIGRKATDETDYYGGNIDDIRIYNRALNEDEITALYNEGICYQSVTVTDVLIINANLTSYNPVTYQNAIQLYPNPAKTELNIDFGDNYDTLNGYSLKIMNALSQTVYTTDVTQQHTSVNLSTWSGTGTYFVHLLDGNGTTVSVKTIILQ